MLVLLSGLIRSMKDDEIAGSISKSTLEATVLV